MRLRRFFSAVLIALMGFSNFSQASSEVAIESIEGLREKVHEFAANHYRNVYGEEEFDANVRIRVGQIDSRLRLAACDDNLTFLLQEPSHSIRNITVKTSCPGERRWTVYVPAQLDRFADVVVAARTLQRGDILTESDLEQKRMNISGLTRGHVIDQERVLGMEMQRSMTAGDVLKLSDMEYPDIVEKGQLVSVTSQLRNINVSSDGVALRSGHLGQRIKVRNERSQRVIDAEITGPGQVTVATR